MSIRPSVMRRANSRPPQYKRVKTTTPNVVERRLLLSNIRRSITNEIKDSRTVKLHTERCETPQIISQGINRKAWRGL